MTLLLMVASTVFAQKPKTVEGRYTYYVPDDVSLREARNTALYRAQIQAIADEFGTIVSQSNITRIENTNGHSNANFLSLGSSDVKGEWIETIGQPVYDVVYEQDMLVVTCQVKGVVWEIVSAKVDYMAKVLRNGIEDKYEDDTFKDGDDLYMSFIAPVSGYLAVYLVDADDKVSCLLPYPGQLEGIYPVKSNQRYVFFSTDRELFRGNPQERTYVQQLYLTCNRSSEQNQVYIIFSPHSFTKAVDKGEGDGQIRELEYEDFQKWLAKLRRHDRDVQLTKKTIIINK